MNLPASVIMSKALYQVWKGGAVVWIFACVIQTGCASCILASSVPLTHMYLLPAYCVTSVLDLMFCTWSEIEERSFSALTSVVGTRGARALPEFLSCAMKGVEALTNCTAL